MQNNLSSKISGNRLATNILKFSFVSIFSAALSFTVIPIISRVFPTEEYGKINMFFTVGNMMMTLVLAGLDSAYIRFFNEPPEGMDKKQLFLFPILIGSIINITVLGLIFVINPNYVAQLIFGEKNILSLFFLLLYVMTLVIFRQLNITYRMEQNAKQYNIQNIAQIIINRVIFVAVAIISPSYTYAIALITFGMLLLSIFYLWKQRSFFRGVKLRIPHKSIKELLMFSIPLMPTFLVVWLNNSTAKLILSGLGRHEDIGIFAMAVSFANIYAIIPAGFSVYWSSFMYSCYETEKRIIKNVHNYVLIGSIGIILIIILMQDILYGMLGINYRGSQSYFMLIMLNPIQALLCETTSYGIAIAKKTKYNMIAIIVGYIVNLMVCYFTIPIIGVVGAAAGIAMSSIMILLVKTFIGQYYYRSIEKYSKTVFGMLIIIGICIGNLIYYNSLQVRISVSSIVMISSLIFYRSEVLYIGKQIRSTLYVYIKK